MKKIILSLGLSSVINCYALDSLLLNGINCSESSSSTSFVISQTIKAGYLEINPNILTKISGGTKFLGTIDNKSCHVSWNSIISPDEGLVNIENHGVSSDLSNNKYMPGKLIEIKQSGILLKKGTLLQQDENDFKFKIVKFNQEKSGTPVEIGLSKIEQSLGQTKIYLTEKQVNTIFPAVFGVNTIEIDTNNAVVGYNNNFINFNQYLDMLNYRYNLTEKPSNVILTIDSIHKNYRLYTAESSYYNINIK